MQYQTYKDEDKDSYKDKVAQVAVMSVDPNANNSKGSCSDDCDDSSASKHASSISIRHAAWLALAVVGAALMFAYVQMPSLKSSNWIKYVAIVMLIVPSLVEIITRAINSKHENENDNENGYDDNDNDNKDDDKYQRPDLFSGWPYMLISVAALVAILGLSFVICDSADQGFIMFCAILIAIDNIIRCMYSIVMQCRVRRWVKWAVYVFVAIDIVFILVVFSLFAKAIKAITAGILGQNKD